MIDIKPKEDFAVDWDCSEMYSDSVSNFHSEHPFNLGVRTDTV